MMGKQACRKNNPGNVILWGKIQELIHPFQSTFFCFLWDRSIIREGKLREISSCICVGKNQTNSI